MNTADHFRLADRFALVEGARHAVVLDLEAGRMHRPNEAARRILALGERDLSIAEVARALEAEFEAADVLAFVEALAAEGWVALSPDPRAADPAPAPIAPDLLWIELTGACNLRCVHCYADAAPAGGELPRDVVERVLEQAAAFGYRRVQLTGGECTLREDLVPLLAHARACGFELIEIFTNGTRLAEPLVAELARLGVHVAVSLHSYRAEVHDHITATPGSFDRTLRGLALLLAYRVPVRCTTIAMAENEGDLASTAYFLLKLGVGLSTADTIRPTGRGRDPARWPERYGRLTAQTAPRFAVTRSELDRNRRGNGCWQGKAAVTSAGAVVPCIFARDEVVGNVLTQHLGAILSGEAMQRLWRLSHEEVAVCRDCEFRLVCRDCRPWALGTGAGLHAKTPRCAYDPYTGEWAPPPG